MTTSVKDLRAKAIAFVTTNGGQADRAELKKHLGFDLGSYSESFNRVVKPTKLQPVYSTGEISPGLFLSRKPVVAYRLT